MVEGLLFLGFFNTSRQLLVLGGFRPLHAINGTIEAFGSEAGTRLSFGFEGHFRFKELGERFLPAYEDRYSDRIAANCWVQTASASKQPE